MDPVVLLEVTGPVALVTLHRPHCHNALNTQVFQELRDHLRALRDRRDVRVVILTGSGAKAFAAGADIAQMLPMGVQEARTFSHLIRDVGLLLENMPQITIAAVNGVAMGGGCELSLACDLRLAAENARFALPETGLGIIPGGGGTQRLPRLIGKGRAMEMVVTGRVVGAQEAAQIGLVNRVVSQAELLTCAMDLAAEIAGRGSYAISLAKAAMNIGMDTDLASGLDAEINMMCLAFATHDKQEGMTAFLEKRPPEFTDF